jgi:hypothetical protein
MLCGKDRLSSIVEEELPLESSVVFDKCPEYVDRVDDDLGRRQCHHEQGSGKHRDIQLPALPAAVDEDVYCRAKENGEGPLSV